MLQFEHFSSGVHPLTKCQQNRRAEEYEPPGANTWKKKRKKVPQAGLTVQTTGAVNTTTKCANDGLEIKGSTVKYYSSFESPEHK